MQSQYETDTCPAALRHGNKPWRLDELKPVAQLSGGGFASVQKCNHAAYDGFLVLKSFAASKCTGEHEKVLVERELAIHRRLNHPNICRLYATFADCTGKHMVQEYVSGSDVAQQRADTGGYLPENVVAGNIVAPLLSALQYLHEQGIIHRDLKPGNLQYDKEGRLKLLDFGIAVDTRKESASGCFGTLDYMAPEAVESSADSSTQIGYAVDIWAMGCLAYELLVGGPPFEAQTKAETFRRIVETEPFIPQHLSDAAKSFLKQTLSKHPQMRPSATSLSLHKWIVQAKPVSLA